MAKRKKVKKRSNDISQPLFLILRWLLIVMVLLVAIAAILNIFGLRKTSYAAEYAALVLTLLMLAFLVRWRPCKH